MERIKKIKDIVLHYGIIHQNKKAIEEMSELIKELCKIDEVPEIEPNNDKYINVMEEIADVIVMMEQLKLFYGSETIEQIIDKKIDRQIERIGMGRD